jgi:hypothetical protein
MNRRFFRRSRSLGPVALSIVYNATFSMTDGRIRFYRNRDGHFRVYQLRLGHLWLDLDIVR